MYIETHFFPPLASGSKIAELGAAASLQIRVAKLPWLSEQGPSLFVYVCSLATPPVGTWPAASISPGSFVETQSHLRSHSRASESESACPCDPQRILCIIKSEKHGFVNFLSLYSRWQALLPLPLLSDSGPPHLGDLDKKGS